MVALIPALRIRNAIGSFVLGWAGIAVLVFVIFMILLVSLLDFLFGTGASFVFGDGSA